MLTNNSKKTKQSLSYKILSHKLPAKIYALLNNKKCYCCPICSYEGPFLNVISLTGKRKDVHCPRCRSYERHRLQYLVFKNITKKLELDKMKILHFAPEKCFENEFRKIFGEYLSADLNKPNVDCQEDLTHLSFQSDSFDIVYASHVLEHIKDDEMALAEIKRILKKTGFAILPVPIIGKKTVEYPEANLDEECHVRCPGIDYFEKYKKHFSKVEIYSSKDFNRKYQVYIYEDRKNYSKKLMPLRQQVDGEKHEDFVPICFK
ncbi:MAG: class I SAM-dependent methyltransferase [Candidatus Omnitrophica bacterium]|nr:class I SAM-dependent methyltransferase [Candidatus Omnitrophota bacterium]MBU1996853.1 class I SAM-dependent methyltransferase [Candidatus Omnitrophota bacterium]MBU4333337.1 class I SAM-dependent methyltransferase [Candidatus Omnitrophota bacterium]